MFFLLIGNRYRTREEGTTPTATACPACGANVRFARKSVRQYLTLFFVLPVFPLGSERTLLECPRCHARFEDLDGRRRAA